MANSAIETGKRKKVLYYEVMRLIAIFFVVYGHTEANGFFLFSKYPVSDIRFWTYLLPSVCCSFCVPLFFAISGALMLHRPEEPLKKLFLKRIMPFGIVLVVVSFLYYFQSENYQISEINPKTFLIILYSYCSGGFTWYMYTYLAYLVTLPLLQSFARSLKNSQFCYLFAVALVFNALIPIGQYILFDGNQTLNPYLDLSWIACSMVLYPLLGYFLEHRYEMKNPRKTLTVLWVANILTLLISCGMTAYVGRITGSLAENDSELFFSSFALISCTTVYLTVKHLMDGVTVAAWAEKLLLSIGKCVFGVYFLHYFVMCTPAGEAVRKAIVGAVREPMLASWLFCAVVIAFCYGVTLILKKIPVVKNMI